MSIRFVSRVTVFEDLIRKLSLRMSFFEMNDSIAGPCSWNRLLVSVYCTALVPNCTHANKFEAFKTFPSGQRCCWNSSRNETERKGKSSSHFYN